MDPGTPETLLAFDVGVRRTGVAIGQSQSNTAQAAGQLVVTNGRFDWPKVDALIAKWQPDRVIIGDPGGDNPHLRKVINRLKSHIQQQHKLAIEDVDETLTSAEANHQLSGAGLSLERKVELRDQIAACLILESYFASQNPG